MPAQFLIGLADPERTRSRNRQLGGLLAFVAGAVNAGGYLAVHRYTSHMTGIISAIADDIVLAQASLIAGGLAMLATFILGALCTALVMNWARRHGLGIEIALPLLIEAVLLLAFGLLGSSLQGAQGWAAPVTVLLLCFIMGLQNALITKLSHAEIRTTHITGLVTDIGIELGKMVYINRTRALAPVQADRKRLRVQASLVAGFVTGGLLGAWGFKNLGYMTTVPLAALLWLLSLRPLLDDWRQRTP